MDPGKQPDIALLYAQMMQSLAEISALRTVLKMIVKAYPTDSVTEANFDVGFNNLVDEAYSRLMIQMEDVHPGFAALISAISDRSRQ